MQCNSWVSWAMHLLFHWSLLCFFVVDMLNAEMQRISLCVIDAEAVPTCSDPFHLSFFHG